METRFETKFARDRALPFTPEWCILDREVPPGGRALTVTETLRLVEYGLTAAPAWLLTPADAGGLTAFIWMPAADRWVRVAVKLLMAPRCDQLPTQRGHKRGRPRKENL